MKNIFIVLILILVKVGYSQDSIIKISKYEEFALFVSGKEFPKSIKDTSINLDFWYDYKSKINEDWPDMDSNRLVPMGTWRDSDINPRINDSITLFYPFSGPDFLHAYILFPNANQYLFLAQEQLGKIPEISTMKQKELKEYLDLFYYSIRDIYQRSYFITGRMNSDLNNAKVKGVLPLILFFMSQTEHCIHDVKYEKLSTKNSFADIKNISGKFSSGECVTIYFSTKNSDLIKTLRYFRCDISDEGLTNAPIFKSYLSELNPMNTYVKSASYLLHYETFTTIRNIILNNSYAVLEDDTGIPYKYFDAKKWDAFLYGTYVKPISDFPNQYLFQKDLSEKYSSGDNVFILPFSLGYHWRSGDQNKMLFIKK